MHLTDCLSYVYVVSKLGVLFQVHIILFNVDLASSSFTCRLTITLHASFSGGLSSNSCAVGRPCLYRISHLHLHRYVAPSQLTFTQRVGNAKKMRQREYRQKK